MKLEDLLNPRTLFAVGMNGEALSPEHGAPLRLVMPAKYGYKSSKLITKLTFVDKGGMGLVADGWPYYSASGDILAGVDHPFEFPDETAARLRIGKGEGRRDMSAYFRSRIVATCSGCWPPAWPTGGCRDAPWRSAAGRRPGRSGG